MGRKLSSFKSITDNQGHFDALEDMLKRAKRLKSHDFLEKKNTREHW